MNPDFLFDLWPRLGDSAGIAWQTLAVVVLASLAALALRCPPEDRARQPGRGRFDGSEGFFIALVFVGTVVLRSPTWMLAQTNVDEAQWIAGAITLQEQYALWGSVDGTTSGPLVIHALYLWNSAFGAIGFHSAKVFTTLIWALVVVFTYLGFLRIMDRRAARLLICPFVGLVALMHDPAYVGYNGEQVPILLLAFSTMLLCRIFAAEKPSHWDALLLGLALGILPYTKMQAVPMGLLLGLYGLVLLYRKPSFFTLLSAVILLNAAVLGYLAATGLVSDFWLSYILENVEYSRSMSGVPFIKRPYGFLRVWFSIEEGRYFVWLGLVTILGAGLLWSRKAPKAAASESWLLWGALGYLAVASFCIWLPGTFFSHYYLFLLHPLMLCVAIAVSQCRTVVTPKSRLRIDLAVISLLFLGTSTPALIGYPAFMADASQGMHSGISPVAVKLSELAGEKTKLTVWGWAPHFYVQSMLPQATSEAHTYRQIQQGKYQEYFLQRYLSQLENEPDLLFVDATNSIESKYFRDPVFDHRRYPLIERFVVENLVLVDTINDARIYMRRPLKEIVD